MGVKMENGVPIVGICDPTAHHGVTHMMLLGRTTSLIVTRWFVQRHVSITRRVVQVWATLNCVLPYFLLWLGINFWGKRVTNELCDGLATVDEDGVKWCEMK
jgi:hypothetical protein